jgi:hypothetical protein
LHLGGDDGMSPSAVLLGTIASVRRHAIHPAACLRCVLTELPACSGEAVLTD